MNTTLTQAEFDALPTWPYAPLPTPEAGRRWKFKVAGRWHIGGYVDRGGWLEIVTYEGFEITEEVKAE